TPCVWSSAGAAPARSPFTRSIAAPVLGTDGIAFPVYTSNGQSGLVVFFGRQAEFSEALLFEAHARCFQLFESSAVLAYMDGAMASVANRERDCLELSSHGLTSEEIAAELGLSPHTVNQYLTNTARKLGAVNRVHVVAKALRLGLID
ncbi:helix-turn-helix transcriptional regulator, partial [Salmonella enterica subsp. enterica]|nr:helix-turn-helix transcriptional regulator [Salmonella enterica subsp. enterica]